MVLTLGWRSEAAPPASSVPPMRYYYFGGGAERHRERNLFDLSFEASKKLADERRWDATFLVDVKHPSTQQTIANLPESSRNNISEFTTQNFEAQIGRIIGDLEDGKIVRGQQLMITVDTHGLQRESTGENVIATTDGRSVLSEPVQRLIKSAKRKGVKLGVVLVNCYSGDIRKDFGDTDGACIISSSSPGRVGTADFHNFFFNLQSPANLEEAFLSSRQRQIWTASQPGINTVAGQRAERDLEVFRNYKIYGEDSAQATSDRLCENTSLKLNRLVELGRSVGEDTQKKWYDLVSQNEDAARALKHGLSSLKNRYDRLPPRPDSGRFGTDFIECTLKNESNVSGTCAAIHFLSDRRRMLSRVKDLAAIYKAGGNVDPYDKHVGLLSEILTSKESAEIRIKELQKILQDPEILRASREVARKKIEIQKWEKQKAELDRDSSDKSLVNHERRLYDALYKHYSKEEKNSNACRDFKLK